MKQDSKPSDLNAHIGYWMRIVSNHVSHSFALRLETQGVTVAEWVLLRHLYDQTEIAPSALAEIMGMTKGAISKLVERLVQKALVLRTTQAADRRHQTVSLTKKGRDLVPILATVADANDDAFFNHLSESQQNALILLLKDVVRKSNSVN